MLSEVTITKFASIRKPLRLPFGKSTLVLGTNAAGKTAICDAISCLFEYQSVFSKSRGRFSGDSAFLQGKTINERGVQALVEREIELFNREIIEDRLRINGNETNDFNSLSSILKVVYVEERVLAKIKSGRDLAKFCLSHLAGWSRGLSKQHFLSLKPFTKIFNSNQNRMVESIEWLPTGKLRIKNWEQDFWLSFKGLSGSERCILLTEVALVLGHLFSKYRPALIIFDSILTPLDRANIIKIANRINSIANPNLQFLFTTWKEEVDSLMHPDCTIKLVNDGHGSVISSLEKRTPKGILQIEERIKSYKSGKEDEFINSVVMPLLFKMGFSLVSRIQHHGPGELGLDIGPFMGPGFEWREAFCGSQVKCTKLNAKSGDKNSINVLIDEVKKALHNKFYNMTSAVESKLDYVFVFLSQYPTTEALNTFNSAFMGERKIIVLNPIRIAELIWKYGVAFY